MVAQGGEDAFDLETAGNGTAGFGDDFEALDLGGALFELAIFAAQGVEVLEEFGRGRGR